MNYYNEWDRPTAAWLQELINQRLIPDGHVDTRSICDVQPGDLDGYTQCHFFAGIGGWSYALQLAGWPPDRPVWTGSCPCQPFSAAGKQKGQSDERHLWPEFYRLIQECRPPVVFGEQVASSAVIGKQSNSKNLSKMPDKQAVLKFLQGQGASPSHILQGLREFSNTNSEREELQKEANFQTWDDIGIGGTVPSREDGVIFQSGCFGNTSKDRCGRLRVDRNPIRLVDTQSMELPFIRSDYPGWGIHKRECSGGDLCGQCDEPQLGTEFDFEDCRLDQGSAQREIERLIEQISGEFEETPSVWIDGIRDDLEAAHYILGACVMAACSVGAPHIRQRLYWVADSRHKHGRGWSESEKQKWGETPICCGLGDADIQGPQGRGSSKCKEQSESGQVGSCSNDSILLNSRVGDTYTSGSQRPYGNEQSSNRLQPELADSGWGTPSGLGDADSPTQERLGLVGVSLESQQEAGRPGYATPWQGATTIPCADGKSRRVEPGIQLLAHGVPARVVRLRGYGNAIVPQCAQAFIEAYMETAT